MNIEPRSRTRFWRVIPAIGICIGGALAARAQSAPKTTGTDQSSQSDTIELSPFSVTTTKDMGYKATNATSGTRLDEAIKNIPMSLEVITSDFIHDTGATDLREALKYSAGIQLQSQNDYTGNGLAQYQNPGGVNNPEMQTANKTDTSVVIRGFTTDNALRDGFRRKVTTDAANISRIEVVRGPAALLYGIGNFGGVVNYVVKQPGKKAGGGAEFTIGSYGMQRGTLDWTSPFDSGKGGYRINMAVQENGDYTAYYKVRKFAIAPIIVYRPWKNTRLTLDTEYGVNTTTGLGFQSIRARADALGNQGRQEHAGFITFPGVSLRSMRWSGPDTMQKTYQGNVEVKLEQHIAEGLDLLVGYNQSSVTFDTRDINASLANNLGPISLWSTVYPVPLDATRGDTDANWAASPVPHSIVAYSWSNVNNGQRSKQARAELNYKLDLLKKHPWLEIKNNMLLGVSTERDNNTSNLYTLDSNNNVYDWKSASDSSPFSFSKQGDGSPSLPLRLRHLSSSTAKETGEYFVYQGKFLKGLISILGGVRRDGNGVSTNDVGFNYADGSIDSGATSSYAPTSKNYNTTQIGVSITPIEALTFYAMQSQGLNPNFSGARDLTGRPMDAVKATNKEFGVKFDLWHGRISGTISHYEITRVGQPNGSFWWAPQTATHKFDPNKSVVYNVTDLNPDAASKYLYTDNTGNRVPLIQWNNNYAYWGDLTKLSGVPSGAAGSTATQSGLASYANDSLNAERVNIQSTWSAAKAAGAVGYWDKTGNAITESAFASLIAANGPGSGYTTINASTAPGAAYMDAVYNYTRDAGSAHPGSDNWPGWFFNSAPASTGYNNASQDTNSFVNNPSLSAPESDRNMGWDGQLIITPTDDWQILFSFEKNNHSILSLGTFPNYPYQNLDHWAPWMFPNGQWGLSGYYAKNAQYLNEGATSTFSFRGLIYPGAQGMDYPKWSWSAFTRYRFTKLGFKGLVLGAGVIRTGPQEYESGATHAGDALKDNSGLPLILDTPLRWTVNVFGRYEFKVAGRSTYVQLNVDNLLNDQHRYGLLWAPGTSGSLTIGSSF